MFVCPFKFIFCLYVCLSVHLKFVCLLFECLCIEKLLFLFVCPLNSLSFVCVCLSALKSCCLFVCLSTDVCVSVSV